jgi:parallel beta-helix repeat protein
MTWKNSAIGRALAVSLITPVWMAGCGDDTKKKDDDSGAGGRFAGCTRIIEASSTTEDIQTALIEAKTGDVLCFEDGTYEIERELSLTVNDVTLRGNPENREAVLLDYTKQVAGKDALSVNSAGFTVEHLSIKNSRGNSIVVKDTERITFRNLKVWWDAESSTDNGAYAVYPLGSTDVLIEDCEVIGASDAGIYVGQSKNIIVRNNVVHKNVAGIEIENSDNALVVGNHTYDNTAGILVFVMPNLQKKDGSKVIVEDNVIEDNNRDNFGEAGTTVSFVPPGVGLLVLAADETEVRNNTIKGNKTAAVLAISFSTYDTICQANGGMNCGAGDAQTDPDLSKLYVHNNTFENNSYMPDPLVSLLLGDQLENVLWDGRKPEDGVNEDQLCLGDDPTSVRVFGGQEGLFFDRSRHNTDASQFTCTLPSPFEKIELPQEA